MMKTQRDSVFDEARLPHEEPREQRRDAPRVVYTEPPVLLGRVVGGREGERVVSVGERELVCRVDPEVDERLLEDGARVLVDNSSRPPVVAGVLMTRVPLTIDPTGAVHAKLRALDVQVEESATLRTRESFVRLRGRDIELYAREVITRARDTARILAAMIRLN